MHRDDLHAPTEVARRFATTEAFLDIGMRKLKQLTSQQYFGRFRRIAQGSISGQILLIAISPILSRIYSPSAFGDLAFYVNAFGIIGVLASLRLELAIPRSTSGKEATQLAVLSLLAGASFSAITLIVGAVCVQMLPARFSNHSLMTYWWAIPAAFLLLGSSNALITWATYFRRYQEVGRSRLAQSLASAAVQLTWPAISSGGAGMIIGSLISQGGATIGLGARLFRRIRRSPEIVQTAALRATLSKYRHHMVLGTLASVIARAAVHLPIPLLMFHFGAPLGGLLVLSQRVIGIPTLLLGQTAAIPFQQALGDAHRRGRSARSVFYGTVFALSAPGFCMLAGILLFGPAAFELVFGPSWREAGVYAQILAPMFFMQLIASPFMQSQTVSGKPMQQLVLDVARLCIVCGVIISTAQITKSTLLTVAAYSAVMCGIYVVYLLSAARSCANPTEQTTRDRQL